MVTSDVSRAWNLHGQAVRGAETKVAHADSRSSFLCRSPSMIALLVMVDKVAPGHSTVLITGESGTGKERIAQLLHQQSPRAHKPFVAINCSAIPDTLLESELFGHAKGSFTGAIQRKKGLFEEANHGTLFLDEVGDLSLPMQAKLLRVLQNHTVRPVGDTAEIPLNVRIVAATHVDLKHAVQQKLFREDLYYRLNVIHLVVPPLRERKEDIEILAHACLKKFAAENDSPARALSHAALQRLRNAAWHGNVRELENTLERAVVLAQGPVLDSELVIEEESARVEEFYDDVKNTLPTLTQLADRYIHWVLEKTGGCKEKAAHILGVNRRTIYRREHMASPVADNSDVN